MKWSKAGRRGSELQLRMAMGRWRNPLSALNSITVKKKKKSKPYIWNQNKGTAEQQLQERNCSCFFLCFSCCSDKGITVSLETLLPPSVNFHSTEQGLTGTRVIVLSLYMKKLRQGSVMLIWKSVFLQAILVWSLWRHGCPTLGDSCNPDSTGLPPTDVPVAGFRPGPFSCCLWAPAGLQQ